MPGPAKTSSGSRIFRPMRLGPNSRACPKTIPRRTMATSRTCLDVIHLLLLGAFLQQFLERGGVGGGVHGPLDSFPRAPQLGRAIRIAQRRRFKNLAMHRTKDVSERNLRR